MNARWFNVLVFLDEATNKPKHPLNCNEKKNASYYVIMLHNR